MARHRRARRCATFVDVACIVSTTTAHSPAAVLGGTTIASFFALFLLHCTLGCGVACALAWPPFLECVLQQCTMPSIGLQRKPPPDEAQCVALGTRSLLLLPAACLFLALSLLGAFHAALLRAGLTTVQFSKRWRAHGAAASLLGTIGVIAHGSPSSRQAGCGIAGATALGPTTK